MKSLLLSGFVLLLLLTGCVAPVPPATAIPTLEPPVVAATLAWTPIASTTPHSPSPAATPSRTVPWNQLTRHDRITPLPPTATPTFAFACRFRPHPWLLEKYWEIQEALGCATGEARQDSLTVQVFPLGYMYRYNGHAGPPMVYVLYRRGNYQQFPDTWNPAMPLDSCPDIRVPERRLKPTGSIGKVWCEHPEVRAQLPGAQGPAWSYSEYMQPFQHGIIANNGLVVLFYDGMWQQ